MQEARLSYLADMGVHVHFTVKLHTEGSNAVSWHNCVLANNNVLLGRRYALYQWVTLLFGLDRQSLNHV